MESPPHRRALAGLDLDDGRTAWRIALGMAAALTLARLAALTLTPLELYPDEAQYWLWSRQLHWGYVSKPPMIAWLIAATTALGGEREAWVRLSAPLVHAGAMLALYAAGRRLYRPAVGLLAAAIWGLMPAVQISALFIATDAPLMLLLALALWAYAELWSRPDGRGRLWLAAGFGAALGLAFLAKFAAAFLLLGVLLHALIDRQARRAWSGGAWLAALAMLAVTFGPNVVWQQAHGFATVTHTAKVNAHWSAGQWAHPGELAVFLLGQFGVFGPVPFAALAGGAAVMASRRKLEPADRLLLCLSLPALALVSIQAFVSHAHAHWAAVAYVAGAVLAAAWLVRWRARIWTAAGLGLQALVAALVIVIVAAPGLADRTGNGRRLARVRGWAETARFVTATARRTPGLTAVAVEDRYMFNELAYYGRDGFAAPGSAPLRMRPAAVALNEAELSSPLRPQEAGKVLIAESVGTPPQPALPGDFRMLTPAGREVIPLGGKKTREVVLQIGEGYGWPTAAAPHSALITRSLPQPTR
jgi:4-amino-4-deoxy-L-arabinose transferase-like glycosyltransferase